VSAHPGHDVKAEAAERAAFLKNAPVHSRSLGLALTSKHTRLKTKAATDGLHGHVTTGHVSALLAQLLLPSA
jgi:hypothetical protein